MATAAEIRKRIGELARELVAVERKDGAVREASFAELEEAAVVVGDIVGVEMLAQELACASERDSKCPTCSRQGLRKGERERVIHTRRGDVNFVEPEFYCPGCRRAFFPSVGGARAGRGV